MKNKVTGNINTIKTINSLVYADYLEGIGSALLVRQPLGDDKITVKWKGETACHCISISCFSKGKGAADIEIYVQCLLPTLNTGFSSSIVADDTKEDVDKTIHRAIANLIYSIKKQNNNHQFDSTIYFLEVNLPEANKPLAEVKPAAKLKPKRIQFKAPGATFEISQDVWLFVNYMTNDKHLLGHETNFGYVCESAITAKDAMYYDFAKAIKGRGGWGVDEFSKAISKISDTKNEYGLSFDFEEGLIRLKIVPIEKRLANPNPEWTMSATALMHAVNARNFTQVKELVMNARVDVLALNKQGKAAYDLALDWFGGDDAITEFLKEVDYKAREAAVDKQLAKEALNRQDHRGFTPLMRAIEKGDAKEVNRLLEAGADTYLKCNYGLDAWDWAERLYGIKHNITEMINEYSIHQHNIDRKAKALTKNLSDKDKQLLYFCNEGGHAGEFKDLIQSGANINCINEHGHTPLMVAVLGARSASAQALIDLGADMDILFKGRPGEDAIGICISKFGENHEMTYFLKRAKSSKNLGTKYNFIECKVIHGHCKKSELKPVLDHLDAGNIGLAKDALKKIIG